MNNEKTIENSGSGRFGGVYKRRKSRRTPVQFKVRYSEDQEEEEVVKVK